MIPFVKMQTQGNDFIFVKETDCPDTNYSKLAIHCCNRREGIGADGLIIVKKEPLSMRIFNQDGSEAKMCGNGMRCFAFLVKKWKWSEKEEFEILCMNQAYRCRVGETKISVSFPPAEMDISNELTEGKNQFRKILDVRGVLVYCTILKMGCLHTVVFDDYDSLRYIAADICTHELFKDGCNVDFVRCISKDKIAVLTYERGVGFTSSCGSGNAASAYVAWALGKANPHLYVKNTVGEAEVDIKNNEICLSGECSIVFRGNLIDDQELDYE